MGVLPQDIDAAMAKSFGLTDTRGVLIGSVTAGSPAAEAGIQRGDVVTAINGERVEDSNQLRLKVSMTRPGTTIQLKTFRDGVEKTVSVKLTESPTDQARVRAPAPHETPSAALDGVSVEDLDYQMLRQLGLSSNTRGVVVTEVAPGSPAS